MDEKRKIIVKVKRPPYAREGVKDRSSNIDEVTGKALANPTSKDEYIEFAKLLIPKNGRPNYMSIAKEIRRLINVKVSELYESRAKSKERRAKWLRDSNRRMYCFPIDETFGNEWIQLAKSTDRYPTDRLIRLMRLDLEGDIGVK